MYQLDQNKDDVVIDRNSVNGVKWAWSRGIRDGRTREECNPLFNIIEKTRLSERRDRWKCIGGPKEEFTVNWLRSKLTNKQNQVNGKNRWSKWLPNKINIFIWKLFRKRLPVKEVLKEKGIIQSSNECELCRSQCESINHMFVDCPVAVAVWAKIAAWWGLDFRLSGNLEEVMDKLSATGNNFIQKKVIETVGYATLLFIWRNRNDWIFKKTTRRIEELVGQIQQKSLTWIDARANKIVVDKNLWISLPSLAIQTL